MNIQNAISNMRQIKAKRKSKTQPLEAPSAQTGFGTFMDGMIKTRDMEAMAEKNRLEQQAFDNKMSELQNRGLGNGTMIAGSGNATESVGKGNIAPVLAQGSLFDATKNINDQGLKYSMKRGKGCTDCSAFTQKVYKDTFNTDIGQSTHFQKNAGVSVDPGQRKYGDLVFFNTDNGKRTGGISHVGYDNGNGTFTHFSSDNGGGVKITPYKGYYPVVSTRRVIN